MSVEYSKLWCVLNNINMKNIELQRADKTSDNILAHLGNNEITIEKIYKTSKCTVDDVLQFK